MHNYNLLAMLQIIRGSYDRKLATLSTYIYTDKAIQLRRPIEVYAYAKLIKERSYTEINSVLFSLVRESLS